MKIKPKIIISSYDDIQNPYYAGGGARAIHAVAKRLTNRFRVVVLTSSFPGAKDEVIDGVRYKRVGISFAGPKIGQVLYQFFLIKSVLNEEYDLWVESFTPPFSTSFIPLLTKKPVVGLVHMLSAEDMARKYKLPFFFVENLGLKLYRQFIVVNKEVGKKISRKNPRAKIFVIPNGVDLPNPKVLRKASKKHILFMGRIEVDQKGLDLLLKAFRLVIEKVDLKLVIAGTGAKKEVEKLKRLISRLSLRKKVKLVGRVEGKRWEKVLKEASVVVIPSRFETFSMVALEALAYQVPVVSFDIEGLKWLPNNVCLKVRRFDFEKLASAIVRLIKERRERKKIIKNSYKFLEKFNWDRISERYNKVFQLVLST